MANWRAGTLTLLLLIGAVVSAQTPVPAPQQRRVFRGGTTVVPLTVTVLDKKGVPVTDLRQSDFTVYENKSQREILNFFPQAIGPGPVPLEGVNGARDDGVAPQMRRTFLVVLNNCDNLFKSLDRTTAFLRDHLLPQDAVALMAFSRTTPFTTDHELVARSLGRLKATCRSIGDDLWQLHNMTCQAALFRGRPNDPGALALRAKIENEIDAVFDGIGPLRNHADLLFQMDSVVPVVDEPGQRQETFTDVVNSLGGGNLSSLISESNRFKLVAGVELLRDLDGERHIVFLASGELARDADDAKIVARRASDAGVMVHMIGIHGFDEASRDVVELTGGYYSTTDYADKALTKVERNSRFSYLLGYAPSNPTLDGRYREVVVKVNRPGVVVRFPHGYYARAKPDPLDVKELILKSRLGAVLAYASNVTNIKVGLSAYLLPRMGIQGEARVEVTIDASQLGFKTEDGIRTGRLELQAYCADAKEVIVGSFGERLDLQADDDTYAQWLQAGIRRTVRVPVMGTAKFVKVVVYDYGSDRVGSFILTLKEAGK